MNKKHIIGLVVLAAIIVVGTVFAKTRMAPAAEDFKTQLKGQGFSPSLNLDVKINAKTNRNGKVTGQSKIAQNFKGKIVEVTPVELDAPAAGRDYWCVNMSVQGTDEFSSWIWFVKDTNPDQLSFASGFGLTCASVGAPVQPFEAISSGDFKGEVR